MTRDERPAHWPGWTAQVLAHEAARRGPLKTGAVTHRQPLVPATSSELVVSTGCGEKMSNTVQHCPTPHLGPSLAHPTPTAKPREMSLNMLIK